MSGQKIIEGLNDILDGKVERVTDMGRPVGDDFSAITCPNCSVVHRFRGPHPKRCPSCRKRLTNLRIVE